MAGGASVLTSRGDGCSTSGSRGRSPHQIIFGMDNRLRRVQGRARNGNQRGDMRETSSEVLNSKRIMSKQTKIFLGAGTLLAALFFVVVLFRSSLLAFFALQADGIMHAGTWEDDPKNWNRAFNEDQPAQVKVIHSKFWRSNHFTDEHIFYFEVEATPEWRDAFLKKRGFTQVSSSAARSFRSNNNSDDTPNWFAPDPVELYDVWDQPGYLGSVWLNKTNGYFFFYEIKL